jgi:hypothetical protein
MKTPGYRDQLSSAEQSACLPCDATTFQPLPPTAQPGYYPGYSTLSQQKFWDEATRRTVMQRMQNIPPIRFFTPEEASLMEAVCARLLPQDDRDEEHRIPLVPVIDDRLYNRRIDGYRFEDMPPDHEAFRLGLQAIAEIARHLFSQPFQELGPLEQDQVLVSIHDGHPPAAQDIWQRMSVKRFWSLLMQDVVEAYYAHPFAWDEIGFGGPAYPRGYMRLQHGEPEPWEVREQRYDWIAPLLSLSDAYTEPDEEDRFTQHMSGQEGTH